ncbi:MAG: hypothetical protein GC193_00015 [Cryomorphaceae bacterium]|nr:hypothetical protein [Cryomorphaceae bacterium]
MNFLFSSTDIKREDLQTRINKEIDQFFAEREVGHLERELLNSFAERSVKRVYRLGGDEKHLEEKIFLDFTTGMKALNELAALMERSLRDWYQAAVRQLETDIAIHKTAMFTHLKQVNDILNNDTVNHHYQTKTIVVLYKYFTDYSSERIASELSCDQFINAITFRIVSAFSEDVN